MDKLERVAQELHEGWREYKSERRWVYGPTRTSNTHPHLIAWHQLDNESQNQDRFIAAILLREFADGNLTSEILPAAIHDGWTLWERIHGRSHPHALPYAEVHAEDPGEHAVQAARVAAVLGLAEGGQS